MAKSITGTNRDGAPIRVCISDRIRFMRADGVIVEDVVRDCFTNTLILAPSTKNRTQPAVVLTEHSWTPLSSCINVVPLDRKAVRMHRSHAIDGVTVSFRRSIVGWVACLGPDRCVHFRQPIHGGAWIAQHAPSLETICSAATLTEAVRLVKTHYQAIDREIEERIAACLKALKSKADDLTHAGDLK